MLVSKQSSSGWHQKLQSLCLAASWVDPHTAFLHPGTNHCQFFFPNLSTDVPQCLQTAGGHGPTQLGNQSEYQRSLFAKYISDSAHQIPDTERTMELVLRQRDHQTQFQELLGVALSSKGGAWLAFVDATVSRHP